MTWLRDSAGPSGETLEGSLFSKMLLRVHLVHRFLMEVYFSISEG